MNNFSTLSLIVIGTVGVVALGALFGTHLYVKNLPNGLEASLLLITKPESNSPITSYRFSTSNTAQELSSANISIRSVSSTQVNWTAASNVPWLSISPPLGVTPGTATITVRRSLLPPGSQKGGIMFKVGNILDTTFVVEGDCSNSISNAPPCGTGVISDNQPPPPPPPPSNPTPPPPPTPTPPPPFHAVPARFGPGDVGLHYPNSQEILWDPRTGEKANQYTAMARASALHFIVMPQVLRAFRDIPSCSDLAHSQATIPEVVVGKFFFLYSLRPLRSGQPYQFHPNYIWDIPQNMFERLHDCVMEDPVGNATRPELTLGMRQLLNIHLENGQLAEGDPTYNVIPHLLKPDTSHVRDGILDPHIVNQPLTDEQCMLLSEAHTTHEAHAAALLEHDYTKAAILGQKVRPAQLAFEQSARNPHEQTLFSMIFSGDIDPQRDQASVDALTRETSQFHIAWHDAFHCDTHQPPDTVAVWENNIGHARAHFLRAIYMPEIRLRTICPLYIGYCPITGD